MFLFFNFEQSGTLVMWPSRDQVMWPSRVAYPGTAFLIVVFLSTRDASAIILHNRWTDSSNLKIYSWCKIGLRIAYLSYADNKVHGVNMRPISGRQDSGGPHVGPMKFAIWGHSLMGLLNTVLIEYRGSSIYWYVTAIWLWISFLSTILVYIIICKYWGNSRHVNIVDSHLRYFDNGVEETMFPFNRGPVKI